MSFRHTLITQFIYNESLEDTNEFIDCLKNHFDIVLPSYTDRGQLTHIVIRSRDSNGYDVEHTEIPALLENARGLLKGDLDIVAAWEFDDEVPRQRVFTVKGRGQKTVLEWLEENNV